MDDEDGNFDEDDYDNNSKICVIEETKDVYQGQ
jgi:hypothetical protein